MGTQPCKFGTNLRTFVLLTKRQFIRNHGMCSMLTLLGVIEVIDRPLVSANTVRRSSNVQPPFNCRSLNRSTNRSRCRPQCSTHTIITTITPNTQTKRKFICGSLAEDKSNSERQSLTLTHIIAKFIDKSPHHKHTARARSFINVAMAAIII